MTPTSGDSFAAGLEGGGKKQALSTSPGRYNIYDCLPSNQRSADSSKYLLLSSAIPHNEMHPIPATSWPSHPLPPSAPLFLPKVQNRVISLTAAGRVWPMGHCCSSSESFSRAAHCFDCFD